MKIVLFAMSILLGCVTSTFAQTKVLVSEVVLPTLPVDFPKGVENSVVHIMLYAGDSMGSCSGVIYKVENNHTFVLTAKHCLHVSEEVYVDTLPVVLSIASTDDDLAVMIAEGILPKKTPVTISERDLAIGEQMFHVGYPKGIELRLAGVVDRTTKDWVWGQILVVHGCSGGPIFNVNGELTGIVWGVDQNLKLAMMEPISDVKRFLNTIGKIYEKM